MSKCLLKSHLKPEKEVKKDDNFSCRYENPWKPERFFRPRLSFGMKHKKIHRSLWRFIPLLIFCYRDLLKTNFKEKVIIFKSLQDVFSRERNWLNLETSRKDEREEEQSERMFWMMSTDAEEKKWPTISLIMNSFIEIFFNNIKRLH